jgi:hypothetical protein
LAKLLVEGVADAEPAGHEVTSQPFPFGRFAYFRSRQ